jgi:hypothetical protein
MSAIFYQTILRHFPEDRTLHSHHRNKVKSNILPGNVSEGTEENDGEPRQIPGRDLG